MFYLGHKLEQSFTENYVEGGIMAQEWGHKLCSSKQVNKGLSVTILVCCNSSGKSELMHLSP